jgi:ATP-independent RNA helicase DbpA
MTTRFCTLPLRPELLEGLSQVGYREMTAIQAGSLPAMLAGRDVTGQAMTGSGKTAAFGLAVLERIDLEILAVQALLLCPTRELAEQVADELRRLAQRMPNVRIMTACGGRPSRDQTLALRRGVHVVVGTPGRLGKHLYTGSLALGRLRVLVLDEADRMMDMGFVDQVMQIVEQCPADRQSLLFSATFPESIRALSSAVQRTPKFVAVASQVEPDKLRQLVFQCRDSPRAQVVVDLLVAYRPTTALVFCETRSDCNKLASYLSRRGAVALALHGQMEQRDRDDVLLRFSNGSASVLVATDVAARGLDIPALPVVIISELSPQPEGHLHRIGRTGRAGETGLALSIVASPREWVRLERIEQFLDQHIERGEVSHSDVGLDFLTPPNRTLLILAGRKNKLRKGDVLGALVKDAGIPPEAIGRIDLMQKACSVAVKREFAQQALRYLQEGRIKKRRFRARLLV